MDLLKDDIKKLYFKFLWAAFGGALIASVYGLVDMAMVGQYHGPVGTAALAVVAPFWNILYSLGLLIGIGGSILYSVVKGQGGREKTANMYFTCSLILGVTVSILLIIFIYIFETPLLLFFGADENLLPFCRQYLTAPKAVIPFFVFFDIIAGFLRNDKNPGLATAAVICGGVFNVFGDYFFVFVMDMGIKGAGIATAMGIGVSDLVMLTHFFKKSNTLRLCKPQRMFSDFVKIVVNGFSAFSADIAMGVMTILFNNTIMHYLGTDELSIYGVIVYIGTFVQCCSYGIGQAAQPLLSINFGAGNYGRIKKLLIYSSLSSAVLGLAWTVATVISPNSVMRIFMSPTESVLEIAPRIIKIYAVSFILLPFNVFSGYYFQATLKPILSAAVSIGRGLIISGALIVLLPFVFGGNAVWFAVPLTELIISIFSGILIFLGINNFENKIQ